MKCCKTQHFIRVCTICLVKINYQRKKNNIFSETITCGPSIYTIDHPDFTVSNFMEKSVGLKSVKSVLSVCEV